MQKAGAVPLGPAPARVPPAAPRPKARVLVAAAPEFQLAQNEDWIEGHRKGLSSRERRRLEGPIAATLDLHGHSSKTALGALSEFFARERRFGPNRVLVIVGKGHHAPGGAGILRASIADWLSAAPLAEHVLAFATAPPHHGGTGAIVVLLASRPRRALVRP
jgi:DNA-nicking Smr family endonuclease